MPISFRRAKVRRAKVDYISQVKEGAAVGSSMALIQEQNGADSAPPLVSGSAVQRPVAQGPVLDAVNESLACNLDLVWNAFRWNVLPAVMLDDDAYVAACKELAAILISVGTGEGLSLLPDDDADQNGDDAGPDQLIADLLPDGSAVAQSRPPTKEQPVSNITFTPEALAGLFRSVEQAKGVISQGVTGAPDATPAPVAAPVAQGDKPTSPPPSPPPGTQSGPPTENPFPGPSTPPTPPASEALSQEAVAILQGVKAVIDPISQAQVEIVEALAGLAQRMQAFEQRAPASRQPDEAFAPSHAIGQMTPRSARSRNAFLGKIPLPPTQ